MSSVRFSPLSPVGLDGLESFAQEFNHSVRPPLCPMVEIRDNDKLFGYFSVFHKPILFPAFHPDLTTPKNFRDAVNAMIGWQRLSSMGPLTPNGVTHIALPTGADEKYRSTLFDKFGLNNMEMELYHG